MCDLDKSINTDELSTLIKLCKVIEERKAELNQDSLSSFGRLNLVAMNGEMITASIELLIRLIDAVIDNVTT
jgi:hypothetical protein